MENMDNIINIENFESMESDNNTKISVENYLASPELIEVYYVPYETKVNICNVILNQVIKKDGCMYYIDSALLDRVKTQVVIESITNLDLSIKDENGLDGYDLLCKENELSNLIDFISYEYNKFDEIIKFKVQDFYNSNGSISGFLHFTKKEIINKYNEIMDSFTKFISNINAKDVADVIVNYIEEIESKRNNN